MWKYIGNKHFVRLSAVASCVGAIAVARSYVHGTRYKCDEKLVGKTVIITGATSGIGRQVALNMASRGARVILACRNVEEGRRVRQWIFRETLNKNVLVKPLDLSSFYSVRAFANDVNASEPCVHVLINNAAVMTGGERQLSEHGIEMQLTVNYFGAFLLTNLLLPNLRAAGRARVVNVGCSQVGQTAPDASPLQLADLNWHSRKPFNTHHAYVASKIALTAFTQHLAARLAGSGVTANVADPGGFVRTRLHRHQSFYRSWLSSIVLAPLYWLLQKPALNASWAVTFVAVDPTVAGHSGKYFFNQTEKPMPAVVGDAKFAERLWAISDLWTRLSASQAA